MKKTKKDVLILCQFYYPEYVTAASLVTDTAEALAKSGLSVDVFCGYPSEYCKGTKSPMTEVHNGVNIQRIKYFSSSRSNFIGRMVNNFSFCWAAFFKVLFHHNYKMIITYTNPPMIPLALPPKGMLKKVKLGFVCYDLYPEIAINTGATESNSILSRVMRRLNNKIFGIAKMVVCLSGDMKKFVIENRNVNPNNVVVIPNWHKDYFKGYKAPADKFFVSYLGNMGTCQDMKTLCDAILADQNDRIGYIFSGHGVKQESVKSSLKDRRNVELYDFLTGNAYQEVLDKSDCFVVSLEPKIYDLCAPSKLYSYLMMGRPVIAIMDDCELTRLLEENNCGIAVRNGDVVGLNNAIGKLSENPELVKTMGENARNLFLREYTEDICLGKYVDTVTKLIDNG